MRAKSYFDIENSIEIAVNDGKSINLISYSFSEDMEKKLNSVIKKVTGKFSQDDLGGVIYTIIKELAINGTKANIKYLFLEENNFDPEDRDSYNEGMKLFKKNISEKFLLQMGAKARKKGLWVKIHFNYNDTGLSIYVKNNRLLSQHDEKRIREKLSKAMQYTDIAQFYMENLDESEGAGMGIALIIILLKAENIDPAYFRIFTEEDNTTIARVEIPFTEDFVSLREQGKEDVITETP